MLSSDLRQVGGFLRFLRFPPPINLTPHNIAEILLKVALNVITLLMHIGLELHVLMIQSMPCEFLFKNMFFSCFSKLQINIYQTQNLFSMVL